MRSLPFKRDLYNGYYRVVAGDDSSYDALIEYCGVELIMKPVFLRRSSSKPIGQSFEDLANLATTIEDDLDENMIKKDYDIDFFANYKAIFCGKRKDWVLNGFDVSYQEIELYYVNRKGGDGVLAITNPENLQLAFTVPRNRLGFCPEYKIEISSYEYKTSDHVAHFHSKTHIMEDLGYAKYDGYIYLKNPELGNRRGNLYLEGTEEVGF